MTEEQLPLASQEVIRLEKVSVFQEKNLILTNVNLKICQGEFVYLIGKTGSGKSSLLKLLYGELPLKDGEATIADYNLQKIRRKDIPFLRRKLGIVFQDFQLLTDRSVAANLEFVMRATGWSDNANIERRIQEVLESVGLTGQGSKMPHQLSGGEQQRVSIARALINHPEIILADEPTGNLDPNTSEDVLKILIDISKKGTAVLMATHDYSLFRRFPSRTVRCEDGALTEKVYDGDMNQINVNP